MSASYFDTVLTGDLRTADDGVGVLVRVSGTGSPRWRDEVDEPTWASCHLNAEMITRVASEKVRVTEMNGLSGDMPGKRLLVAQLLDAAADLVRDLALDADHDCTLNDEYWQARLAAVRDVTFGAPYPPENLFSRRGRVTVIE